MEKVPFHKSGHFNCVEKCVEKVPFHKSGHFNCVEKCVEKVPFHKSGHFNSTILKNIQYASLCIFKSIAFPLWRNEVICYKNVR